MKILINYYTRILQKNNAYICIFSDNGKDGIPYQSQNQKLFVQYMMKYQQFLVMKQSNKAMIQR